MHFAKCALRNYGKWGKVFSAETRIRTITRGGTPMNFIRPRMANGTNIVWKIAPTFKELKHGACTYVYERLSFFKIHFIILRSLWNHE